MIDGNEPGSQSKSEKHQNRSNRLNVSTEDGLRDYDVADGSFDFVWEKQGKKYILLLFSHILGQFLTRFLVSAIDLWNLFQLLPNLCEISTLRIISRLVYSRDLWIILTNAIMQVLNANIFFILVWFKKALPISSVVYLNIMLSFTINQFFSSKLSIFPTVTYRRHKTMQCNDLRPNRALTAFFLARALNTSAALVCIMSE